MARWNLKGERDRRGSVNPDAVSIPARREWRGKTGAARRAPTRLRRSAGGQLRLTDESTPHTVHAARGVVGADERNNAGRPCGTDTS